MIPESMIYVQRYGFSSALGITFKIISTIFKMFTLLLDNLQVCRYITVTKLQESINKTT